MHPLDLATIAQLTVSTTEDGTFGVLDDGFLLLAGAVAGLSGQEAFAHFLRIREGLPAQMGRYDVIRSAPHSYLSSGGTLPGRPLMSVVFELDGYQAFAQRLAGPDEYRVKVWVPACAVCGYVALFFAQIVELLEQPADETESRRRHEKVEEYKNLLLMVATAAADDGTFVFKGVHITPPTGMARSFVLAAFRSAVRFMCFHELAHLELGHLSGDPTAVGERKRREHEADRLALRRMYALQDRGHPQMPLTGGAIMLLGSSVTSPGPDDAESDTHPSLVERFRELCLANDELREWEPGRSREGIERFIGNLLANLHDRDRCPAWLGKDRREVLGLPPDHEFDYRPLDFESHGKRSHHPVGEKPPETKNLLDTD